MDIAAYHKADEKPDRCDTLSGRLHRWAALFCCFYLVWVFMFIIAPWIGELPAVKPLTEFIAESGIDAGALYYTEVEEASEAELNMYNTIKYLPRSDPDVR